MAVTALGVESLAAVAWLVTGRSITDGSGWKESQADVHVLVRRMIGGSDCVRGAYYH